jgi:hypothetical protein
MEVGHAVRTVFPSIVREFVAQDPPDSLARYRAYSAALDLGSQTVALDRDRDLSCTMHALRSSRKGTAAAQISARCDHPWTHLAVF